MIYVMRTQERKKKLVEVGHEIRMCPLAVESCTKTVRESSTKFNELIPD